MEVDQRTQTTTYQQPEAGRISIRYLGIKNSGLTVFPRARLQTGICVSVQLAVVWHCHFFCNSRPEGGVGSPRLMLNHISIRGNCLQHKCYGDTQSTYGVIQVRHSRRLISVSFNRFQSVKAGACIQKKDPTSVID